MNRNERFSESTKALIEWIVLVAVSGGILLIIF
jgi:hypothetical protein